MKNRCPHCGYTGFLHLDAHIQTCSARRQGQHRTTPARSSYAAKPLAPNVQYRPANQPRMQHAAANYSQPSNRHQNTHSHNQRPNVQFQHQNQRFGTPGNQQHSPQHQFPTWAGNQMTRPRAQNAAPSTPGWIVPQLKEELTYRYSPANRKPMSIRSNPDLERTTNQNLNPGDIFLARSAGIMNGIEWVKLSDGRGWAYWQIKIVECWRLLIRRHNTSST